MTFLPQLIALMPFTIAALDLPIPAAQLPVAEYTDLRYYLPPRTVQAERIEVDVCIHGATCAGVTAAVQASRMGKRVILLAFDDHVGGLTAGGLSATDAGGADVCGGIAREFYAEVGQSGFRPSAAEAQYRTMLSEAKVPLRLRSHLAKVDKDGTRITAIHCDDGLTVTARQFIDCSYEGDLVAMAGVATAWGREANAEFGETLNGITAGGGHNWPVKVDPYVNPGDPTSGLLPGVNADRGGAIGAADHRIQAYCFRMRVSTAADRIPWPKPANYDPQRYLLLARLLAAVKQPPEPKWGGDVNNHHFIDGAFFTDHVGANYGWPAGDYLVRERIFQEHVCHHLGMLWFLANDPQVAAETRAAVARHGLPRDEYRDTGGFTHQLYVREARRMRGAYVMTQNDCQSKTTIADSIGLGSYGMDSHHCQRVVVAGAVRNEGNVEVGTGGPYRIAYRAITPKAEECTNLLVPVAMGSTHISYGSIRMEPVFMLLGQSAATAACQAIDAGVTVQQVDYAKLRERLVADRQILDPPVPRKR